MRTPKIFLDFVRWRWAPTVALSFGAVGYVVLAVLVIPDQIGASTAVDTRAVSGAAFATRIGAPPPSEDDEGPTPVADTTPRLPIPDVNAARTTMSTPGRRGFSPPLDRPEPPPVESPTTTSAPFMPPPPVPPPGAEMAPAVPPPVPQLPESSVAPNAPTLDPMAPPANMPAPSMPPPSMPPPSMPTPNAAPIDTTAPAPVPSLR